MKILLLNDNPVVNKLVTLSAQKTSDDLDIVQSVDDIKASAYDLLVVDDASYAKETWSELKGKITFSESLFICARDTEEVAEFTSIIKKPFLPTDLVELFSQLSEKVDTFDLESDVTENLDSDFAFDELSLDEEEDEISLDSLDFDEDLSLEDDEEFNESVLDDEEAQKVKDLLMETSEVGSEEFNLEDDLDIEDDLEDDILLDDGEIESDIEDLLPSNNEITESEDQENNSEDELNDIDDVSMDLEDDDLEETFNLDDDIDLETQIETAVDELSDEELSSEVTQETLLDIATSEIDLLDSLTSKELKLAIGEEFQEEEDSTEVVQENTVIEEIPEVVSEANGVEALKKLLEALNDKSVVASMKGMKININITLGGD